MFRREIIFRKKSLRFRMVSGCKSKICLVFWWEKNLAFRKWFLPLKKQSLFLISDYNLFKNAESFFFSAILHSQNIVKEMAYIPTSFQALVKAHFLSISARSIKDNEKKKQQTLCESSFIVFSSANKLIKIV